MNATATPRAGQPLAEDFPHDGNAQEKLEFMLQFAILAPSSHNTQPWLFRLNGNEVELIADLTRSLRIVDPFDRELIMSCGAALHHLRVAAKYFGHALKVDYFPDDGDPDLLARIKLGLSCQTRAHDILLFSAIQKRRTNRLPFSPEPIPKTVIRALQRAAAEEGAWLHFFESEADRFEVADLIAEADRAQWQDKRFRRELANWVTPNRSVRRDGIPGYAQGLGDLVSHAEPLVVRTFDLGKGRAAKDRDIALHSPGLAALGVPDDSRADWLAAGQALSAVLLRARMEDVWASFLNQAVEVLQTQIALRELVGVDGVPQILLRLGFGDEVRPTPRRPLRDVLRKPRSYALRDD